MRKYNLNIAGYNISFEASPGGPDLITSERFLRNICATCESDIYITVHKGSFKLPKTAERVFHAPLVEEINGVQIRHKSNFWSIWKYHSDLFIQTIFPLSSSEKSATLKFSLTSREWDLWIEADDNKIDPFEYPLDGLILYYLTVIYGDIMIHASGINMNGRGYLFSGVSGKGKSTIARLWEESGAMVIHDDRLIIRKTEKGYKMYNTPVYNNDVPQESSLDKIFLIEHGMENKLTPVKGALAISLVMTNCIQHNWGHDIIARLLGSVSIMCATVPTVKLSFKPDKSVINLILKNE
jgi:hypothetical protein